MEGKGLLIKAMFLFVMALTLNRASLSAGQKSNLAVAEFYPEKPKEETLVRIVYHAGHEKSRFSPRDTVYVIIQILTQDYGFIFDGVKMDRQGNDFILEKRIASGTAVMDVSFITLSPGSYDYAYSALQIMIYTAEGNPVRNACYGAMHIQNYDQVFREEMIRYPDNYAAYRGKWDYAARDLGESALPIINADMRELEKIDHEDVGLWFSLSYGYLQQKNEAKSREYLLKILAKDPGSNFILGAIPSFYGYAAVHHLPADIVRQVEDAVERAIDRQPTASVWRWLLARDRLKCSLARVEKICDPWIADDKDNPFPYARLAWRLNKENAQLERAAFLMDKAIALALSGSLRLHLDICGTLGDLFLGNCYQTLAEIKLKLADYGHAYGCIQAARALTSSEPQVAFIEGEIWLNLGNLKTARKSFLEAWRWGHKEAKGRIRVIWERSEHRFDDFETWFGRLTKPESEEQSAKTASKNKAEVAPLFFGKDMNGETISSADWQGKVAVLNFWFTTCTPCKAEIPDLNRLVAEFKDVVFVAVAINDSETLQAFLKKFPFHYRILPDPRQEIAQEFAITLYPTHIVIDQNGNLYFRRNGGGSGIYNELAPVIRRLLEQGKAKDWRGQPPARPGGS